MRSSSDSAHAAHDLPGWTGPMGMWVLHRSMEIIRARIYIYAGPVPVPHGPKVGRKWRCGLLASAMPSTAQSPRRTPRYCLASRAAGTYVCACTPAPESEGFGRTPKPLSYHMVHVPWPPQCTCICNVRPQLAVAACIYSNIAGGSTFISQGAPRGSMLAL